MEPTAAPTVTQELPGGQPGAWSDMSSQVAPGLGGLQLPSAQANVAVRDLVARDYFIPARNVRVRSAKACMGVGM